MFQPLSTVVNLLSSLQDTNPAVHRYFAPTMSANDARQAAEAFSRSYGEAIDLTHQEEASAEEIATALVRHYSPKIVCFDHGHLITAGDDDPNFWQTGVTKHLQRFQKTGLGWKMKLRDYRVETLSETAAACHLTWEFMPTRGDGWSWTNVYGWRDGNSVSPNGSRGAFEYVVSDNETEELMKRIPGFMEL
jgi:hypothetical protein